MSRSFVYRAELNFGEMNNDDRNGIHVAIQRAANTGAEAQGVQSGGRRQIAGGRAVCPPRTSSAGWFGHGASAVALSTAEKGVGFGESGDSCDSIALG